METKTREELSEMLRAEIASRGVSQPEIARLVSEKSGLYVKQPYISEALAGKRDYILAAMASALLGGRWEKRELFEKL